MYSTLLVHYLVSTLMVHVFYSIGAFFSIKSGPQEAFEKGGARLYTYGRQELKTGCAAENFANLALKSAIFELQKNFRHKCSCTMNLLKNENS